MWKNTCVWSKNSHGYLKYRRSYQIQPSPLVWSSPTHGWRKMAIKTCCRVQPSLSGKRRPINWIVVVAVKQSGTCSLPEFFKKVEKLRITLLNSNNINENIKEYCVNHLCLTLNPFEPSDTDEISVHIFFFLLLWDEQRDFIRRAKSLTLISSVVVLSEFSNNFLIILQIS